MIQSYKANANSDSFTKTKVLVTLNPNKAPKNEAQKQDMIKTFVDILGDMEENLEEICGKEPYMKKISTKNLSFEIGGKYHRLHCHFILSMRHYVAKYSISKLRLRLKDWLDDNGIALERSWAVFLTLAPSFKENYAIKEARKIACEEHENDDPEELERLSDPREMKTYGKVDVLDPTEVLSIYQNNRRKYNTKEVGDLVEHFEHLQL